MRATLALLTIGAGLVATTACASTIPASAVPKPSATFLASPGFDAGHTDLQPTPHGWLNAGSHPGSLIYVASGSQVKIFPESGFNPAQIGAITDGVTNSYGLFVDGNRDLFVANLATITAYHPGALSPYKIYKDPARPMYVVKDHAGTLYAANRNGSITEYAPHQTRPYRTIHTPGVEADGINLDDSDNLYVAYRTSTGIGSIEKFRPNSRRGRILGMQLDQPQGLQIDHSGNILVVDTGKDVVDIFPPGSQTPSQVVPASVGVTQVVLREAGENMYVSNWHSGIVSISHYPPGKFESKIETNEGMQGIALSNQER